MKKNVLALSITAALVGLGFGAGANATTVCSTASFVAPSVATAQQVGHVTSVNSTMFTAGFTKMAISQGTLNAMANTTMIKPANADKTGFRGATNSDDVFDFQVFLSPGDVWSVNTPLTSGAAGIRVFKDT